MLNDTVTTTVNLQLPVTLAGSIVANNSASDVDAVKGSANISVTKTHSTNTVVADGATAHTISVANVNVNGGPLNASGAVISDLAAADLSCTAASICTAIGEASCAASILIASLRWGYTLPGLPASCRAQIMPACGVSATGL